MCATNLVFRPSSSVEGGSGDETSVLRLNVQYDLYRSHAACINSWFIW